MEQQWNELDDINSNKTSAVVETEPTPQPPIIPEVIPPTELEFAATGRRKRAVARVRIKAGTGKIIINGRPFEEYFPVETHRYIAIYPLIITNTQTKFDIKVRVEGGGIVGQAGAIRHGLARVLVQVEPALRPILKKEGLLTRDPREKERKKTGQPGARKRFQFSKR